MAAANLRMLGEEPVEIDGKRYTVRQDMVRGPKPKEGLGFFNAAVLGGALATLAVSRRARLAAATTAGGLGASLALLYVVMKNSKEASDAVVSRLIPAACEGMDKAMRNIKKELLKDMKGDVLDFGSGDGQYLEYVAKQGPAVTSVTSLEPLAKFHPKIEARAERLQLPFKGVYPKFSSDMVRERGTELYDFIILGNVLCEVPDQKAAVGDLFQMLRPGGKLYFIEHVAHEPGTISNVVQRWIDPVWSVISGGCHCDRESLKALRSVPWDLFAWDMYTATPILGRIQVGIAVKPSGTQSGNAKL
ncbi:Methyltransferase-like protein 7B [Hondaea fermentalgiana]|uniref:Methyltransferase-like protein 7B n=1 Tax=Hondaea fermentalgiana TaxID=2315210 RepID=A0A2R5GKT0_9STRA|nr:Methyltransferase-like protein 7B [Hondaea fermentalgiana]|eukprot:GBG31512.1 Methyltransferase-like protein 7B [Hondaea fermentalgiana]